MEQILPYGHLRDFTRDVFLKMGCSPEHADLAATVLLSADLRGLILTGLRV